MNNDQKVEQVEEFVYLWVIFTTNGKFDRDIMERSDPPALIPLSAQNDSILNVVLENFYMSEVHKHVI